MSEVETTPQGFRHKDMWTMDGRNFVVQVSRHSVDCSEYEGPHRWCVYAYIYPKHPHFARFDGTETLWQDASRSIPLHGGPSLVRKHTDVKGDVTAYQVGCDYNHLDDDMFTHYATAEDAYSVFNDARELHAWLTESYITKAIGSES